MSDFLFRPVQLYRSPRSQAARLAVLYPLAVRHRSAGERQLLDACRQLQSQWRARVGVLSAAGCTSFSSPRKITYARNCSMDGICEATVTDASGACRQVGPCRKTRVCPWCYARRVGEFHRVVVALFSTRRKDLALFTTRHAVRIHGDDDPVSAASTCASVARALADANARHCDGIAWRVTGEPDADVPDAWRLTIRFLAVLRTPDQCVYLIPRGWRSASYTGLHHDTLRQATVSLWRYPTGLMHGDPVMTSAFLNGLEQAGKLRLFEASGKLRNPDRGGPVDAATDGQEVQDEQDQET